MHDYTPPLIDQASPKPTRKVTAGGFAAALVTVGFGIAAEFGWEPTQAGLEAAVVTVVSFITAYMVRDRL